MNIIDIKLDSNARVAGVYAKYGKSAKSTNPYQGKIVITPSMANQRSVSISPDKKD